MLADVIVDLQYGDCGKGKIASYLCSQNDYTHVIRYNGGCNAGHTIYHNGKKLITHHIPCGVLHGIRSVIGPGCVLNLNQFFDEIVICFDSDESGYRAAVRAAENSIKELKPEKQISFLFLPSGEDPDSFVNNKGKDEFLNYYREKKVPIHIFLFEHFGNIDIAFLNHKMLVQE